MQNCTVLQFANSWLSLKDLSEVGWQTLLEELDNDNDGKISLSEFEALRTSDIYRKVFRTNWCLAFVGCTKRIKTDTSFFTYSLQLADTAEYSSIFTWWQIEYWSTGKLLGTDMVLHKIISLWVDFCLESLLDHSIVKIRIIIICIDTFKIIHPKSSFCGDEYMAVDLEGVDNNFGECVIEEPLMNTSRPKENKIEIRTKVFKILSYCYILLFLLVPMPFWSSCRPGPASF